MEYMVIRLGKVDLVTDNKALAIEVASSLSIMSCAEVYLVSLVEQFVNGKQYEKNE